MKFSRFASMILAAASMILTGCEKNPAGGEEESDAVFSVKLTSVEGVCIKAAVSSTGTGDDSYICFCSKDMTSDLAVLAAGEVKRLGDRLASQLSSGNRLFVFEELDEFTDYRVIAAGVKADGSVYGTPVAVKTKTGKGAVKYSVNPAWKVSYCGRGLSAKGEVKEMVSVDATSNDRYFTFVYPSDALSTYSSIGQFIDDIIGFMGSVIASYNAQGIPMTWKDITLTESIARQENKLFADNKQQYAFAIGVDENGESTGLYAMSEAFMPEYIEPTDAYAAWAGTWAVTGENAQIEENGSTVDNTRIITVAMATSCLSFSVVGFGIKNGPMILTAYDGDSNEMLFYARAGVCESTEAQGGMLGFYAGVRNALGKIEPVLGDGYLIARAKMAADGKSATITPVAVPVEGGSDMTPVSIGFSLDFGNGAYAYYTENPTFPVRMVKVEVKQ